MDTTDDNTHWFSNGGCVVCHAEEMEVFIDGTLISRFAPSDVEVRNVTLVGLSLDARIEKGKLAAAFNLGPERLRRINRQFEKHGIEGIRPSTTKRGRKSKVTRFVRKKLFQLFAKGFNAHQAFVELGNDPVVSYPVVCRIRQAWSVTQERQADQAGPEQLTLDSVAPPVVDHSATTCQNELQESSSEINVAQQNIDGQAPRSSREVQHVGAWLLLAMVYAYGLHDALFRFRKNDPRWRERLRVVVDGVILALGIGQRCVEGVRRLETPSGNILLCAKRVPSESWTRRVLKKCVEQGSAPYVHLAMTQRYLQLASARSKGVTIFYVDNHLRPYTGKQTLRKGWRMQDKCVVPGATDLYVHDEDGRPVYRLTSASNECLTTWLTPVLKVLKAALGDSQRMLVAFDRAGAFPEQLAELRDEGFEFVTYERRPYQALSESVFGESVILAGETYGIYESHQANLRGGRGRVRRIAVLTPEGHQINLLAISSATKERLLEVMFGRWVQENAFKHGHERWGINQLDRRSVKAYSPQTIIPNPARRRADNALRLARHREGELRNQLARMKADHPRREKVQQELLEVLAQQENLEALRPHLPQHAALMETELKDKLVYHDGNYKMMIDTIRIACANAESELALVLSQNLRRSIEAKKILANIFAAPGQVQVNEKMITVTLKPAANRHEQEAIENLFHAFNSWKFSLPGDPKSRPLLFRSHL